MASARPIHPARIARAPSRPVRAEPVEAPSFSANRAKKNGGPSTGSGQTGGGGVAPSGAGQTVGITLDGGWDRRLTKGVVHPDRTIDLHGHTLASAHALLDAGLARAIGDGDRVLLLVTGRPPREGSARGAIRGHVKDWLALSRHARHIAAVRGAHPRHGGAGALYIILRRARGG
ncbi:MAG: Smr/MutS family protein [Sphingomonas taxi]